MNEELICKINKVINETRAELLSSEIMYQDKFITLVKEIYKLPNNKIISRDRVIRKKIKKQFLLLLEHKMINI